MSSPRRHQTRKAARSLFITVTVFILAGLLENLFLFKFFPSLLFISSCSFEYNIQPCIFEVCARGFICCVYKSWNNSQGVIRFCMSWNEFGPRNQKLQRITPPKQTIRGENGCNNNWHQLCASYLFVGVCDICTGNVNVPKFLDCFCAVVKQVEKHLYNHNVGNQTLLSLVEHWIMLGRTVCNDRCNQIF